MPLGPSSSPEHYARRPDAVALIHRLGSMIDQLGGRQALYALLGGRAAFAQHVAKPAQLSTYFGAQQSLPKEETFQRIRTFLNVVEPAVAAGTPIDPATLRAVLQADIDARAARAAASVRRYR